MDHIVAALHAPPVRVTGRPSSWARDGAIVGAVTGYVGPAAVLFGLSLHPWLVACTAAFALGGALLGLVMSWVLERLRGRVPLPVLGVTLPVVAVATGSLWAATAGWLVGAPVALAATFGGIAVAFQVGMFWFPYTVLAVLGGRRWPVVAAACVVSPFLGLLARWAFLML